ncbi:LRA5 [Symbiodinium sp. CCMP2456]|nr:LRA5 [Symbiodinium sp. CCMP2456]
MAGIQMGRPSMVRLQHLVPEIKQVKAIFLCAKAVLPSMLKSGYGRIVNIASISGKDGNAGMLAYSSSKAAVINLTKVMGKEYANLGKDITINCIAPAVVQTAMVDAMPPEQVKYMTDKIPMARTGKLDEVAATILFAASQECSFTTGFCFDASGGRTVY